MKKGILLGIIFMYCSINAWSQTYQVVINGGAIAHRHNFECETSVEVYLHTDKSTTPVNVRFEIDQNYDKNNLWTFSRTITVTGKILFIKCVGTHRDDPSGPFEDCETKSSGEDEHTVSDSEYPCPQVRLGNRFMGEHDTGSYMDIQIKPINMELSYFNTVQYENEPEGVKYLPQDFPIKLKASAGFLRQVYAWEYSVGNLYSWQTLNPAFIDSDGSEINISGSDILSFEQMIQTLPVYIRVNYTCGTSNILELQPKIAAPKFNRILEMSNESCPWKKDGKILFEFNRNLEEGEEVEITGLAENNHLVPIDYEILPPNQCRITNLEPGLHSFQLLGSRIDHNGTKIATSVVKNSNAYSFSQSIQAGIELKMELISHQNLTCSGGTNGQISARGEGGSGTYKLICMNGIGDVFESDFQKSMAIVDQLPAGVYSIWMKDSNGCETAIQEDAMTILEPDEPIKIDKITLFHPLEGEENGSVMISINGGTAPYAVHWRQSDSEGISLDDEAEWIGSDNSVNILNNLPSGLYYAEIVDDNGCKQSITAMLEDLPPFDIQLSQTGTIGCYGDAEGQLEADVKSGGAAPYLYEWYLVTPDAQLNKVGENSPILSGIVAGTYRLKVIDSNAYEFWTEPIEQTQPNPVQGLFQTEILHCYGDENGYLKASFSGGSGTYTYQWLTGNPDHIDLEITGLKSGNYSIKVMDENGCSQVFTEQVKQPEPIIFSEKIKLPSCKNMNNGNIELNIHGGTAPHTISWSTGDNASAIHSLAAGTYDVTVTDRYTCKSVNKQIQLSEPEAIELNQGRIFNVSAFGRRDGSALIEIKGGSKPYLGICKNESGIVFPVQGTNYPQNAPALVEIRNLPVGNYTLLVQDNNYQQANPAYQSCSAELQFSITEPPPLQAHVNEEHHVNCFNGKNGKLKVKIEGGSPYETGNPYFCKWYKLIGAEKVALPDSENKTEIDSLSAGNYQVEAIDKNKNSKMSAIYTLINPDKIKFKFTAATLTCYSDEQGWVEAVVSGGQGDFNYQWSTGEKDTTRIDHKKGGTYSLTVTDERGCTLSDSTQIASPQSIKIDYKLSPPLCAGHGDAFISLNISGGEGPYHYQWSNGQTTAYQNHIHSGQYDVRITDDRNCYQDTSFIVPEPIPLTSQIDTLIQPKAYQYLDGLLRVKILGGARPYQIRWTNEAGLVLTGTVEYVDSTAFATLEQIPGGRYSLHVEDENYSDIEQPNPFSVCGCILQDSFDLPQPDKLEVTLRNTHYIQCHGTNDGEIRAEAIGGVSFKNEKPYQYQWYKDGLVIPETDSLITKLGAGNYQVVITDSNGIILTSEIFYLQEPAPLKLSLSAADLKCSRDKDGWAEVNVAGGTFPYTYDWSNEGSSSRIENIPRGNYFVLVTDHRACETTGNVKIVQTGAIQAQAELIPPTCYGGSDGAIKVSFSGGQAPYSYQWNDGDKSFIHKEIYAGKHQITVSDFNACSYEIFNYELSQPDSIIIDLGRDWELCKEQNLEINAFIPEPVSAYHWFDESGKQLASNASISLQDPGTYRAEVLTAKGCHGAGKIKITRVENEISADFVVASQVPLNENTWIVNISQPEPESIEWILPKDSSAYQVQNTEFEALELVFIKNGEYSIGMKSLSGNCEKTIYKTIQVMNKEDIVDFEDADEPMLKSFIVSPNPSKGDFNVKLELKEAGPVILQIVNSGTGNKIERRVLNGNKTYNEHFNLPNAISGTYILNLYTPKASSGLKVIIHQGGKQ